MITNRSLVVNTIRFAAPVLALIASSFGCGSRPMTLGEDYTSEGICHGPHCKQQQPDAGTTNDSGTTVDSGTSGDSGVIVDAAPTSKGPPPCGQFGPQMYIDTPGWDINGGCIQAAGPAVHVTGWAVAACNEILTGGVTAQLIGPTAYPVLYNGTPPAAPGATAIPFDFILDTTQFPDSPGVTSDNSCGTDNYSLNFNVYFREDGGFGGGGGTSWGMSINNASTTPILEWQAPGVWQGSVLAMDVTGTTHFKGVIMSTATTGAFSGAAPLALNLTGCGYDVQVATSPIADGTTFLPYDLGVDSTKLANCASVCANLTQKLKNGTVATESRCGLAVHNP
jgi:hypothetical protein